MNRTDRLLALVLSLQSQGIQRAEDLADQFEVSKRTIYRDLEALAQAGIPIVAVPGQGYHLLEGYFLPPLTFNEEEATVLVLGIDFVADQMDVGYQAASLSAKQKIEAVLSATLRSGVKDLQESIAFLPSRRELPEHRHRLQILRRALVSRRSVRLCYTTRHPQPGAEAVQIREVDPYGLVYFKDAWFLIGHCHLRADLRHFRLDRIDRLEVLDRSFVRPEDPFAASRRQPDGDLVVRALFDRSVARWVQEAHFFYQVSAVEHPEGLLVTLKVHQIGEVLPWLLSWGSQVRVLEPVSVQECLKREAEQIQALYWQ